jgi:DNA-binding beta-propeller fold protein YncE
MTSRRRLLVGAAAMGASLGLRTRARSADIVMGTGRHRYQWVPNWGPLPGGADYGNTHGGIVLDASQRVYVNTDTAQAVLTFDTDGRFLGSWGKDFAGGLHGMNLVRHCDEEILYLTHTARHEAVKATLDGQVMMTFQFPDKSGVYKSMSEYMPTSVAVAPDGSVFVADGYGKSWVHKYAADGAYVRSWGGLGTAPGMFRTPHGVWVDTRRPTPVLIVADRENGRLQIFDLDGKLLDVVTGIFRRPCGAFQQGDDLVIPDLGGRVTILDRDNKLITHLGDNPNAALRANNMVDRPLWQDGYFLAPHSARWDADGNLYVMDWNYRGRVTKLRRMD